MFSRFGQMLIQPFVPDGSVEAFDVGILLRLARLDKERVDATLHRPGAKLMADDFWPIVSANDSWRSSPLDDLVQRTDNPR